MNKTEFLTTWWDRDFYLGSQNGNKEMCHFLYFCFVDQNSKFFIYKIIYFPSVSITIDEYREEWT